MEWDEFTGVMGNYNGQVETDIECPQCGKKIYFDSRVVLTSYPPQYSYWCTCGWSDTSTRKWDWGRR